MNTKLAITPSVKALGEGRYRFKLSDDSVDRDGDTINPRGWQLEAYQRNPVVLWAHKHDVPAIGRCPYIAIEGNALVGDIQFSPPGCYGFADEIRGLVQAGHVHSSSVEFRPLRATKNATGTTTTSRN
jgi:hypothetical protein